MDGDSRKQKKNSKRIFIYRNVPKSNGIRYINKDDVRLRSSLLEYHVNFLPIISTVLWVVFLVFKY